MVYPVLYLGGLFLRYFCHALTFGQFTAYQLVCDLVRAALMRGLRMAVERSHAEGIYTGLVSKFRAIVAGQRLEDHVPIAANLALEPLQGLDRFGGGLILDLQDDFGAGRPLGHYQTAFAFALGLAYHAIDFPVERGLSGVYGVCSALYASVARVCHVGAVHLALAFLWVALWQVLIAQGWEKAHFYVAVAGRLAYPFIKIYPVRMCG